MAKNLENVVDVVENEEITVNVVEKNSKIKEFGSKVKNGVQKHGKKALKGAAVIGLTGLGFALGSKFGNKKSDDYDYDYESNDSENYFEEAVEANEE